MAWNNGSADRTAKVEPILEGRGWTVQRTAKTEKSRPDEDQYIRVSEHEGRTAIFGTKHGIIKHIHDVRALNLHSSFKPVVERTNLYEINGWMAGINKGISYFNPSLSYLWFSYVPEFVWEEPLSLVKRLTTQPLGFVSPHRGRTLLSVNADMEAAPLLGMADALLLTISIPSVAEEVKDAV
ncbi:hypothetical protein C8R45DRAFT_947873 [Mycena sanguinolenta]|nr:hypothetical protein C8R45DRAFT_947873 [Mycena sanguinolenta]